MTYPELAAFDSTPEQDLALQIQMKQDPGTGASSPGNYLVKAAVEALLNGWVERHVVGVQRERIKAAFDAADSKDRTAVALALKVDLAVAVEDEVAVPLRRSFISRLLGR